MRCLIALLLIACGPPPPVQDPLASVTLPDLPDWTDKYATLNTGDMRFFNISELMQTHGLSRLEAVEVQNGYRDQSRAAAPGGPEAWWATALAGVKGGKLESGLKAQALADAAFIVVFDLDDTLYDQGAKGAKCADLEFQRADGKAARILLVPGWQEAFTRIRALGGLVVLFSANRDEPTLENLAQWTWDGQPLLGHPGIAGVLTNSHLIRQSKAEGQPVLEASKDLRLMDEKLERVIIVDDNPTRLFQYTNTRVFKKFRGEAWCSQAEPEANAATREALPAVVREIEESRAWQLAHPGTSFAGAWLPYALMGELAVNALVASGLDRPAAIEYVRLHPKTVDVRF